MTLVFIRACTFQERPSHDQASVSVEDLLHHALKVGFCQCEWLGRISDLRLTGGDACGCTSDDTAPDDFASPVKSVLLLEARGAERPVGFERPVLGNSLE